MARGLPHGMDRARPAGSGRSPWRATVWSEGLLGVVHLTLEMVCLSGIPGFMASSVLLNTSIEEEILSKWERATWLWR